MAFSDWRTLPACFSVRLSKKSAGPCRCPSGPPGPGHALFGPLPLAPGPVDEALAGGGVAREGLLGVAPGHRLLVQVGQPAALVAGGPAGVLVEFDDAGDVRSRKARSWLTSRTGASRAR